MQMNEVNPAMHTLVVGLGKTGLCAARFLRAKGVRVAVTDSRPEPPGLATLRVEMPELPLYLGGFAPAAFAAAELIVISPGVAKATPAVAEAVARGVPVIGDIELFARHARAPVVAITGSNGKSTVTSLVGAMARNAGAAVAVGGNLGEPALDLLDDAVQLYVLELSSFQLETTASLHPLAATVLNLSADHMDRYPTLADYAAAKARVYHDAVCAVVNLDDPFVPPMAGQVPEVRGFTLGLPPGEDDFGLIERDGEPWLAHGKGPILPARELSLPGRHNLANALAALALGDACGLPLSAMIATLRTFPGLPHRTQLVGERAGVRWYDDSKGTNPGATVAALEGLIPAGGTARAVLIAGGDGKGADFAPLAPTVTRTARAVVLIGRDAPRLAEVLEGLVPLHHARDMDEAVRLAAGLAEPGDCVLLSPACASFDMFDNYEHRGRVFAQAVATLIATDSPRDGQ